ncbi:MAG: hypothetical protein R2698_00405 [Microthrixaceae bacterium]
MPAGALPGIGPATHARLHRLGIVTVADLADIDVSSLTRSLGDRHGRALHELAHGRDDRPVVADRSAKSISHEETFVVDVVDRDRLERELGRLARSVGERLRGRGDGTNRHHQGAMARLHDPHPLGDAAPTRRPRRGRRAMGVGLLAPLPVERRGVRLVGIGVSGLTGRGGSSRQLSLLDDVDGSDATEADLAAAIERIRDRFGADAIGSARLAGSHGFAPGGGQWGPSSARS